MSIENDYTGTERSLICELPYYIYGDNIKRCVMLSDNEYTIISQASGIELTPIPEQYIIVGPKRNLGERCMFIDTTNGNQERTQGSFDKEIIDIQIILRSGQHGSLDEQSRRVDCDILIITNILMKIFSYGKGNALTVGYPIVPDPLPEPLTSYAKFALEFRSPIVRLLNLNKIPVSLEEKNSGYTGGVKLLLQSTLVHPGA